MATYVLKGASWRSLHCARTVLEMLAMSLRPTACSLAASSKQYFSLPPETPTMHAMRQMEYPEIPADSSIFEEDRDGYASSRNASREPAVEHAPRAMADMPALLIAQGKYGEARRVLDEMRKMRLRLRSSPVFLDAAIHVLRNESGDLHKRYSAFRRWYSLIPPPTSSRRLSLRETRVLDLLLLNPVVNLPIMVWYVCNNVSKGYFLLAHAAIVRDVIRLSHPDASIHFVNSIFFLSAKALRKLARLHGKRVTGSKSISLSYSRAKHRRDRMLKVVYGTAINQLCKTDRIHGAVRLLQQARRRNIPVHTLVYSRLITKLESTLDTQTLLLVKQLFDTRPAGSCYIPYLRGAQAPRPQAAHEPLNYSDLHDPSHLAAALRIVRRQLSHACCPKPGVLVHLIEACLHARRFRILSILRKKSYTDTSTAMIWLLAEMLLYFKHRDAPSVSLVFYHNFHMIGVPRQSYHHTWFLHAGLGPDKYPPPQSSLQRYAMSTLLPVKHKLWPSTHHTALVWRACVKEVRRKVPLKKLYWELLAQVTAAQQNNNPPLNHGQEQAVAASSTESPPSPSSNVEPSATRSPYKVPRAAVGLYDDAHFNIFIRAFGKDDPAAAARVVSDMYRMGIEPSVETMVQLLRSFATNDSTYKLMQLLERMEASFSRGRVSGRKAATADPQATDDVVLPPPNSVAYSLIIDHLLEHHRPRTASQIALRMLKNLDYRLGTDTRVDRLLYRLIRLLSHPRRKHREDGSAAELMMAVQSASRSEVPPSPTDASEYPDLP